MPLGVITGSSSGIGNATAIELASRGYDVVIHGHRNIGGLQSTARQLSKLDSSPNVTCCTSDLSTSRGCRDLIDTAYGVTGRVDAWVNNAGADVLTGEFAEQSFERKIEKLWEVDVMGTIRLSRIVSQKMVAQGKSEIDSLPCIVNTGWDQAESGMEGDPGQMFCPTKAAIQAFTKSLALSVAPNVRVNCVSPGWIKTKWGDGTSDYWDNRARSESLLKRWGTPSDVAKAISFLICDAGFVNAQNIPINGGFCHSRKD